MCDSDVVWYVLLRAVDLFHSVFRCYPGYFAGQVETDIMRLKVGGSERCLKVLKDKTGLLAHTRLPFNCSEISSVVQCHREHHVSV